MVTTLQEPQSTDDGKIYSYSVALGRMTLIPFLNRVTFSNAAYTALAADRVISQTGTLSAARVVTLPAANAVPAGTTLLLVDESGTVGGAWNLSWARAGTDTINGGTANVVGVAVAYGSSRAVSDGSSKWTILADYVQPGRVTFSNANYTAVSTDKIISQIGTLSAARVVTLPAASAVLPGTVITLVDDSGTASGVNTLSWAKAGGDTLQGGTGNQPAVMHPYGSSQVVSDGSTKWIVLRATAQMPVSYFRTTFSNAAYTALSTDRQISQIGTMSAQRLVTLPAANSVLDGTVIQITDESGTVTTANSIAIARSGTDTINGTTANQAVVSFPYGSVRLQSDGAGKWIILPNNPRMEASAVSLVFSTVASVSATVTFAVPFVVTPMVTIVMLDTFGAGACVELTAVSTTAFTVRGFNPTGATFNGTMTAHWQACEPTQ